MRTKPSQEAGFTLIETLIAIIILVFALMGITNLMLMATSSNYVASQGTAATAVASQQMELLQAIPFDTLNTRHGGSVQEVDFPTSDPPDQCDGHTPAAGEYSCWTRIPGVAKIYAAWTIAPTAEPTVLFISVRAQAVDTLGARRSTVTLTTLRRSRG